LIPTLFIFRLLHVAFHFLYLYPFGSSALPIPIKVARQTQVRRVRVFVVMFVHRNERAGNATCVTMILITPSELKPCYQLHPPRIFAHLTILKSDFVCDFILGK
jgi:hypothetical protein